MRLWNYIRGKTEPEQRAITPKNWPLLTTPPAAGVAVTTRSALGIPAVFAAVSSVADTVSTLPLPVFRRDDQGGAKDYAHPVYDLLNKAPNPVQTAKSWRAAMVVDLLSQGEHFSEVERNGAGEPVGLWRVDPAYVRTDWDTSGRFLRYWVGDAEFDPADLIHVLGFSTDGFRGTSPFALCRDSLSLTLALERFGCSFMKQGARPGGILKVPAGLTPEDRENARESWQAVHMGSDNAGRTAVLPQGFDFDPTSIAPEEAQYHESRVHQMRECQRITRTPPHLSADFERQTYANLQYARADLVQNTIRPLVVAIEQELNRKLLNQADQRTHFAEHVLEGLLRGSFTEQVDALTKACGGPLYTQNEARKILGLPPVGGGDVLLSPVNMQSTSDPTPATEEHGQAV